MKRNCIIIVIGTAVLGTLLSGQSQLIDFEDVSLIVPAVETYTGPGGGLYHNGSDLSGGYASGGVQFTNSFTDWGGGFTSWGGWAYSTTSDTTTQSFSNQYSANPGTPYSGQVYGIGYVDSFSGNDPLIIDLPNNYAAPQGIALANTAYTALTMENGDGFARAFIQDDTLVLTIRGLDLSGVETGTVTHYLADFRGSPETHFIQGDWQLVDLTGLGTEVDRLSFSISSTDSGEFGINTPAYFAIDNLELATAVIPEPRYFGIVAAGLCILLIRRRRI